MKPIASWFRRTDGLQRIDTAFPGRWIGAVSLLIAPPCFLIGGLLKAPYNFYYPDQIQAFTKAPVRLDSGYSVMAIGFFVLWPALLLCAQLITSGKPVLGRVAGVFAILGVLVNASHEAINHIAYQLTGFFGPEKTTEFIHSIYGSTSVAYALTWTDNLAWILIALGLFMNRRIGWFRALCIAAMTLHHSGILKGFSILSVVLDTLLCIAFMSLGYQILRGKHFHP